MDLSRLLTSLGYGEWIPVATSVVGLFSVLAVMMPQPSPTTPTWFKVVRKLVDWIALNIGNAKNAGHPDSVPSSTSMPAKSIAAIVVAMMAAASMTACVPPGLQSPVVTTSTGKTQVSGSVLGNDLIEIGQLVDLGIDLLPLLPHTSSIPSTINQDLSKASASLREAGTEMATGEATTGDLAANVTAADAAFKSAIAAIQPIDAGLALKLSADRTAFLSALTIYNSDAARLGGQTLPVPAS